MLTIARPIIFYQDYFLRTTWMDVVNAMTLQFSLNSPKFVATFKTRLIRFYFNRYFILPQEEEDCTVCGLPIQNSAELLIHK